MMSSLAAVSLCPTLEPSMRPFITSMRTPAMSVPSLVLSLMKEDRVIGSCFLLGVIYSGGE